MVEEATGVVPLTSPPATIADFDNSLLQADIIYFRLHGFPMMPTRWFGEDEDGNLPAAIGDEQIRAAKLPSSVVILANCYGDSSPMVQDFYQAGASAVIAGSGPNYASGSKVIGADKLAREMIEALQRGLPVEAALIYAKAQLGMTSYRMTDRDTLEFHIMEKKL